MENFFYNDKFYSDIDEFIETIEEEYDCDIKDLPKDFTADITESELKPILTLSIDDINLDSDNFSEDESEEFCKITKVLKENIDFDKINSLMPKNYQSTGVEVTLTKKDLLQLIS